MRTPTFRLWTFEKKISDPIFFFFFLFGCFCRRFCHADSDSRDEQQAILLKKGGNFRTKMRVFPIGSYTCICFSGEKIGMILSRRSRLSRTSKAPSRLSRPRPIDSDAGHDRQKKIFPSFFGQFQLFFRTSPPKINGFFVPGI